MRFLTLSILVIGISIGGCAFFRQHTENVKIGVQTPYGSSEPTVWEQGRSLVEPLSGIPYVQWVVTPLGLLAGLWFADRRGEKLKKGLAVVPDPHPGLLSNIVQTVANISRGVFEVGPDGSPMKRTWKTVAAGLLAGLLTQVPAIHTWALDDPTKFGSALVVLTGLLMGLEKILSNVQPVQTS